MNVRHLEKFEALNSGAALWIVPDSSVSTWAKQLDWYLNFQIFRARRRKPLKTQDHVVKVVQDLSVLDVDTDPNLKVTDKTPLLIAAHQHLPTQALLVLPWTKKLETWLSQAVETAEAMQLNAVRLFLPDSADADARQAVKKHLNSTKISVELV